MSRELTERQQKFLAVLFDEAGGDVVSAKKLAGYSEGSSTTDIVKSLKDEILEYKIYLPKKINDFIEYQPISDFPSTYRDISFLIEDKSKIVELERLMLGFINQNLKETFIFDYYDNVKTNQIKIGVRFIFQAYEQTLTDNNVDDIMSEIIKLAFTIKGVTIPGIDR